jgi:adenosylhomocysteine nucleosidase
MIKIGIIGAAVLAVVSCSNGNTMIKIGIIGAEDIEVAHLKSLLTRPERAQVAGIEFFSGQIGGCPAVVAQSGICKVNAAICAQLLITRFRATHLVNTGIAGAVSPELSPLDIVVSTSARYHDVDVSEFGYPVGTVPKMPDEFFADAGMLDAADKAAKRLGLPRTIVRGRIATGDAFISDAAKRNTINALFSPACVEMEGAAVAHTATLNNTPFVIIRCISDRADGAGKDDYTFNQEAAAETSAALVAGITAELFTRGEYYGKIQG